MSNRVIRTEQIKQGDEILYTKEIIESVPDNLPTKKIWGLERKEFITVLIQFIGLTTILITWLTYLDDKKEKRNIESEKLAKELKDSLKSIDEKKAYLLKIYSDSLQTSLENNRAEFALNLQRHNIERQSQIDQFNQQMDQLKLEQTRQLFRQGNVEERKRIKAQTQLDLYLQTISTISELIADISIFEINEKGIGSLDVLANKIRLTNNDSLYNIISDFQASYRNTHRLQQFQKTIDDVEKLYNRLQLDFCDHTKGKERYYVVMSEIRNDTTQLMTAVSALQEIINKFRMYLENRNFDLLINEFVKPLQPNRQDFNPSFAFNDLVNERPKGVIKNAEQLYNIHKKNMSGNNYGQKSGLFGQNMKFELFKPAQNELCENLTGYLHDFQLCLDSMRTYLTKEFRDRMSSLNQQKDLIQDKMYRSNLFLMNQIDPG